MEGEVRDYLVELGFLRGQIRDAIKGLDDKGVNWHPLSEQANSIYAIISHLTGSESFWVRGVIGKQAIERDRDAEFRASGQLSELLQRWEQVGRATETALGELTSSELAEPRTVPVFPGGGPATVRWCIAHIIGHYGIHVGHIQVTRQLWDQHAR